MSNEYKVEIIAGATAGAGVCGAVSMGFFLKFLRRRRLNERRVTSLSPGAPLQQVKAVA